MTEEDKQGNDRLYPVRQVNIVTGTSAVNIVSTFECDTLDDLNKKALNFLKEIRRYD